MRRVLPLFLACAFVAACAAPEDEEIIGSSSLRVITLGEGDHVIEAELGAGEFENVSFETADDTLVAVIQPEVVTAGGQVLTSLNEVPTVDNAQCNAATPAEHCSFLFPGQGSVVVGAQAGPQAGAIFRILVSIRPAEGISTSP